MIAFHYDTEQGFTRSDHDTEMHLKSPLATGQCIIEGTVGKESSWAKTCLKPLGPAVAFEIRTILFQTDFSRLSGLHVVSEAKPERN